MNMFYQTCINVMFKFYILTACILVFNVKCFVAVIEQLSWYDARDNCIERGGRLAEVCESGLNDALLQVLEDMGRLINVFS